MQDTLTAVMVLVLALHVAACGEVTNFGAGAKLDYSSIIPRIIKMDIPVEDDGRGGIIAHDLNSDGLMDFIVTKPGIIAAYDNFGRKLWVTESDIQITKNSEDFGLPGWYAPGVQAADIDDDHREEVLFLTPNNQLTILEGESGKVELIIGLKPVPDTEHWEHLVIANFRGKGDQDLLLQATNAKGYRMGRYIAAYSIDELLARGQNAEALWQRNDFIAAAHSGARLADLDGDGRDEVLGPTIVGPDGKILFELPIKGHIDAIHVDDIVPENNGLEVLALEEGGRNRIVSDRYRVYQKINRIFDRILPDGNHIFVYNHKNLIAKFHFEHREPQNAAIGDFDPQTPGLEIWCRSRYEKHQKPFVFNANGKLIQKYEMDSVAPDGWTEKGVEVIYTINWDGTDKQLAAAKERHKSGDVAIFDPLSGTFLHRFKEKADRIYVADVEGDWREELIILNGNEIHIYSNTDHDPGPDRKRHWASPYYRRNKMTYNYYNP